MTLKELEAYVADFERLRGFYPRRLYITYAELTKLWKAYPPGDGEHTYAGIRLLVSKAAAQIRAWDLLLDGDAT